MFITITIDTDKIQRQHPTIIEREKAFMYLEEQLSHAFRPINGDTLLKLNHGVGEGPLVNIDREIIGRITRTKEKPVGVDELLDRVANWLPDFCYTTNELTGKVVKLTRGRRGYENGEAELTADEYNKALKVTPRQVAAMEHGAMWGWETMGANPIMQAPEIEATPGTKVEGGSHANCD